jgi:V/A-type H+-transporting ATPase subunit I
MKKVSLIIHNNYLEDVLKSIHNADIIEIINISKQYPDLLEEIEKAEMHPEAATCSNYELRLTRMIDILKKIQKHPSGLKAMFNPQLPEIKTIEESSLDDLYSYVESILHEIELKILNYEKRINQLNERRENIQYNIEQLSYLKDFKINISDLGESEYLYIVAGITTELTSIKELIKTNDTIALYSKQFGTGKKREWAVILVSHINNKEKIEKLCREKILVFDFVDISGNPKDVIQHLEKEKIKISDEKNKINSILSKYATKNLNDLLATREELRIERIRREISNDFGKTKNTHIIKGWVLEKDEAELKSIVSKSSNDHVIYNSETPSLNPDNPPVHLNTPGWTKTFRMFLDLFATPRYNEIDPVIFMGIFFVLFFGIMLGDAGYGLMIFLLSIFGYVKFSKYSETIKDWSFLGLWLGIVTIVVGLLTNSFFGDLIPRFFFNDSSQQLYSLTIAGINFPIEPLRNPLTILTLSLIFGLIHLNLGIILAIYQSYKNKDYKSLITQHFSWIPIQIGGGLLIGSFLLHMGDLGTIEIYIAAILSVLGIILRLIHAGPLGFFDITGYIGDWLSYARLLALGLGTTGMALAFNIVAEIIPQMIPVIGIIFTPIILIIAHTANLGLQTLGAGVHSLRLQYVEFFNRFYEGGGKKFNPFSIKRTYTKIKEEK